MEGSSHEDANRELRSIMLSLLHLPPMPAVVTMVERDGGSVMESDHSESSHTVIATLVEWHAVMDNSKFNNERMAAQAALQTTFHEQLAKVDLDGPIESIYSFYCHHTRLWVNCYTPIGNKLLFKPLDSVCAGDKVHSNMLSYAKAQYHYLKDGKEELEIHDRVPFAELLRKCAQWSVEWEAQARAESSEGAREMESSELPREIIADMEASK